MSLAGVERGLVLIKPQKTSRRNHGNQVFSRDIRITDSRDMENHEGIRPARFNDAIRTGNHGNLVFFRDVCLMDFRDMARSEMHSPRAIRWDTAHGRAGGLGTVIMAR
jgi:hypothetical protein